METVTKMRLSKDTYNILKNFAAINSNILISPGNVLKTISPGKNIYVEATISEDFDVEVPIWDLNKFLGVVSMFSNPDLEFHDTHVVVSNGRSSVTYYYSEPSLLTVPTRELKMPKTTIKFDLDEKDLKIFHAMLLHLDSFLKEAHIKSSSMIAIKNRQVIFWGYASLEKLMNQLVVGGGR